MPTWHTFQATSVLIGFIQQRLLGFIESKIYEFISRKATDTVETSVDEHLLSC